MYKLEFTLKQHTPIIHFQHDQEGATLRATEVKSKFDQYLICKLGGINALRNERPSWFVSQTHNALAYKVRFTEFKKEKYFELKVTSKQKEKKGLKYVEYNTESYPLFLSNMGGKQTKRELKNFSYSINIKMVVYSLELLLLEEVKNKICDFFMQTNFGNRQTKGFGSFYLDEDEHFEDDWYKTPTSKYYFDIYQPEQRDFDFKTPFAEIELFYRAIRGGINQKKKLHSLREVNEAKEIGKYHKGSDGNDYIDVFYFKSLMFLYAKKEYDANWEKRKIKEEFFQRQLKEQELERLKSDQLTFKTKKFYLFRDLLGYSTDESWRSYKSVIKKVQAFKNSNGKWEALAEKNRNFQRFTSPILFKPIEFVDEDGNSKFRVFIILNQDSIDEAISTNRDFIISKGEDSFYIQYPENFKLDEYFKFFLNTANFEISNHVEREFQDDNDEYEILDNIFSQLIKNEKNT